MGLVIGLSNLEDINIGMKVVTKILSLKVAMILLI